jgi:hypothetical protein
VLSIINFSSAFLNLDFVLTFSHFSLVPVLLLASVSLLDEVSIFGFHLFPFPTEKENGKMKKEKNSPRRS